MNVESCFGAFLALFRLVVTRSIFPHATQFGRFTLKDLVVTQHFKDRRAWRWRDTVAISRVADGDHGRGLRSAWPENEL